MATRKNAKKGQSNRRLVEAVKEDVVAANRILAQQRVLDGYGHVSARHPSDPGRFFLSRSRAPQLVTPADLMEFDLDSNALHGDERNPYVERFIHGQIYRARPDVMAVVHSHSPAVIPFACSSVRLQPIYHMSAFLYRGSPVFDIRKRFGMTDMLVRNNEQGAALAEKLGAGGTALMRGHGFVAVGDTIPIAVYRAIYTQTNAALQQNAIALGGEITYLDPEEAAKYEEVGPTTIGRPWELWKKSVLSRR
jgi:ribulose-5-phosphate 4-epimerase/fuculose-1-phosphate aldolase